MPTLHFRCNCAAWNESECLCGAWGSGSGIDVVTDPSMKSLRMTDAQHEAWKAKQARAYADQERQNVRPAYRALTERTGDAGNPPCASGATAALHCIRRTWAHRMNVGRLPLPAGPGPLRPRRVRRIAAAATSSGRRWTGASWRSK